MKKTILRSTLLLIIFSVVSKVLSFLVRILLARTLSEAAMSYYTLASPTMVFIITLAQMGIPSALSKVIAQSSQPKKPIKAAILLSIANNLIISLAFLFVLPIMAHLVLRQDAILPVLHAILMLIPCVTCSGLLKGYLYGMQYHHQATASSIYEEASRIAFLMIAFHLLPQLHAVQMAQLAMLSISVGEIASSLYMFCVLLRKKKLSLHVPKLFSQLNRQAFDEVLSVSIPMTGSRFIGSLTYFLEPIVMMAGVSVADSLGMMQAYGQLHGYVLPIITMPSFITVTLSNVLLPSFTYHYARGNQAKARKLFDTILGCCFFIGLSCSLVCYVYSEEILQLFYHSSNGALLLRQLAWPFTLYSLQAPLSSVLHALSLSKKSVLDTFLGSFMRILCIFLLSPLLKEKALMLGIVGGMLITTISHAIRLTLAFRHDEKKTHFLSMFPS